MTNSKRFRAPCALLTLLGAMASLTGCDAATPHAADDVGVVRLELLAAPADVGCIKLTVTTGGQTITNMISPTAGGRTVSILNNLAVGSATFSGQAYEVTCDTSPLPDATWVADPATLTVTAGTPLSFQLSFHRREKAYVSLDFPSGPLTPRTMSIDSLACGAMSDGTIHCHGADGAGRAGDGQGTNARVNTVLRLDATKIAASDNFLCGLLTDGGVSCWGENNLSPTRVSGVGSATDIDGGYDHACAVSWGYVTCWGDNRWGELGQGDQLQYTYPVNVPGLQEVVAVSASDRTTCAVTKPGALYCWGSNDYGQIGDGSKTMRLLPVRIRGLSNVIGVSVGWMHTCALQGNGVVSCWGDNSYAQLGDGTTVAKLTPQPVVGLGFNTQVAAGGYHTCALATDGSVKCWGGDLNGQIGDGTAFTSTSTRPPTKIASITSVVEISSNALNSCARTPDSVYCWGDDSYGQLGDGGSTAKSTPFLQVW